MTEADPRTAIIRVLDASGATAGSGFLLTSDGLIATCAHVVAAAGAGPGQEVQICFLLRGLRSTATVIPEYWREPAREDVALLQLVIDVPAEAGPLALRRSAGSAGNRFMTFGFPEALAESGMWGYGVVGDIIADPTGVALLQLTGTTETSRGFSGGPVIDQPSHRVVGMVSSITPADRHGRLVETAFATPTETLREICPRLQVADVCPYRSLDFFDEEHAVFFFGRGKLISQLLAALRSQPRFLAVLGPSGSGKSSVVRAGLVAQLRHGALPGSSGWDISIHRPAELGASAKVLEDFAERVRAAAASDGRAVLVIDQFEELFTLAEEAVLRLGTELARLAGGTLPATVVLTMRDDFYSHLAAELPELMNGWVVPNIANIPATLSMEELAEIIKGPADRVGLAFENGLVEAIIDEAVAASPPPREVLGARSTLLPLLEFALTQLWQLQDDGVLRRAAFRELGGVAGGLARWADAAYYALPEDARPIARRILTLLTRLGDEGRGMPDSRQQRFLEDFSGPAPDDPVLQILGRLVTARLLVTRRDEVTGRVVVELIHDALLREWRLLRDWLHEDREFLSWRQNLEYRLRSWSEAPAGSDPDEFDWLRGRELDQALHWLQTRVGDLDARQRAFIEGSLAARQRQQERERTLRERAEQQQREADRQRQIAETRGLVARLRADAEGASALLTLEPARALASAIATTGTNVAALGGEPLGFVQASLFATVRAAKERRVFTGHGHVVTSVAFDPQGQWIVSGSHDRTVRLWSVDAMSAVVLGEHEDGVLSVAFSPDGQVVASGGADRAVRLWRRDGTALAHALDGHHDSVLSVAFSPDGQVVAAGSADGGVYLWSMVDFRLATRLQHDTYVASVAFNLDGRVLATACGDATVRLWHLEDSSSFRELAGHDGFVTCVAFSPDGRILASAGGDRTIRLWTPLGRGALHRGRRSGVAPPMARHRGLVTSLAFSPDGTALVSAGEDGAARLWDLTGAPIHAPLLCGGQAVTSVALSADGRRIAGGCGTSVYLWDWLPVGLPERPAASVAPSRNGRTARRWDRGGDQVCPAWLGHDDIVGAVAFTSDGRRVVSAGGDRTLRLWALDGTAGFTVPDAHDGGIPAVACSPRGFQVIASGGRDNLIRLWDLSGSSLGAPFRGHTSDVMALAFSPDGELIASASRDHTVRLWRLDGTPQGAPFIGHQHSVVAVAISPDGTRVASASGDGTVRLWRLDGTPDGEPFVGHHSYVHAVAFSPDGQTLASGGDDRCVRLWDAHGRQLGQPLRAHTEQVRAVVFHPAGQLVVSAGGDGTIRTWDRAGGPVTRPLEGHAGSVLALAVSPDGELMVTGGEDGTVRLLRLGSWRSWLREGCERLVNHPLLADDADEIGRAARDMCRNLTSG